VVAQLHSLLQSHTVRAIMAILAVGSGVAFADDDADLALSPYRTDHCGALCLYIALRSLDVEVASVQEIADKMGLPPDGGYSLAQLAEAAQSYGMQTCGVETSAENLAKRAGRFACIAHYDDGHFVNLLDVEPGMVHVIDAPQSLRIPVETFDQRWSQNALLISNQPILSEDDLPIDSNWPLIVGVLLAAVVFVGLWILLRRRKSIVES
jgi:ABC-type bacteriocin/lantibiotic exporter with double-glycine peptidase domain